jgi:arylsulfatase A-like enzyme
MVDARIGQILQALRETGQEEETVIIFASDHGDGLAGHRWNQKQVLYEEVVRVPFVVSWKGSTLDGVINREHLVGAGQDLLPTMCDFAGIPIPHGLTGRSVRPLAIKGQNGFPSWPDSLVIETEFANNSQSTGVVGRMLRAAEHKYIVYSRGLLREQLFNITNDPGGNVEPGEQARTQSGALGSPASAQSLDGRDR